MARDPREARKIITLWFKSDSEWRREEREDAMLGGNITDLSLKENLAKLFGSQSCYQRSLIQEQACLWIPAIITPGQEQSVGSMTFIKMWQWISEHSTWVSLRTLLPAASALRGVCSWPLQTTLCTPLHTYAKESSSMVPRVLSSWEKS